MRAFLRSHHRWIPLLALMAPLAGEPLLAQQVPLRAEPRELESVEPAATRGRVISVDFPGGSLFEYIETVKAACGGELNIVVPEEAKGITMPALSIKRVSVDAALKLITKTVDPQQARVDADPVPSKNRGAEDVYVLMIQGAPKKASRVLEQRFQVFSLRQAAAEAGNPAPSIKPDAVLTAIDTALGVEAGDDRQKPVVKYHADSGLLMVRGTEAQLAAVEQVMQSIYSAREESGVPDDADAAAQRSADLAALVKSLEEEIRRLKAEIAELRKAAPPPRPGQAK